MEAVAEIGRNPGKKRQIQPERADAGRDGQTNPSRETKFSSANDDREKLVSCSAGLGRDWHSYMVHPYSAESQVLAIHTT